MRLNTKSQIKSGWDCWCVANCDFFGSLNEAATWFRSGICLFTVPIPQIEFVGNERAKTDKKNHASHIKMTHLFLNVPHFKAKYLDAFEYNINYFLPIVVVCFHYLLPICH